jgi:glycosyltransferase involved in cell wall biosynthesis
MACENSDFWPDGKAAIIDLSLERKVARPLSSMPSGQRETGCVRVLFATYPWAFVTPGGGERQLLKYASNLPAHGIEVVLHDQWNPALDGVDAVHFFSCMGGSVHFCNFVSERGRPLVITSSLWIDEATRHLYPIGEIRSQLALADVVVTNSDLESEALATVLDLPRDLFMTVMNGVDPRFAAPHDPSPFRETYGIDGPFVLNVANIEKRKNQLNLIRALSRHDPPLVMIGQVREPAYADQVFAEGEGRLRYLGFLEHESPLLPSAYAACAAFVLPSTLETPGLAALEAAAAGAPVVVTRTGAPTEYFGALCEYVDPADPADIARGIAAALASGPAPELSAHIIKNYTWPHVTAALPEVYRTAVERRHRAIGR